MVSKKVQQELEAILAAAENGSNPGATEKSPPLQQVTPSRIDKIFQGIQKTGIYALCLDIIIESLKDRAFVDWKRNSPERKREITRSYLAYGAVRTFFNMLVAGSATLTVNASRAEHYSLAAVAATATAFTFLVARMWYRSSPVTRYWH